MRVYLDLVMGLNFLVDLLLLTGTNRLAGYPAGLGRAAVGAAVGGLYGGACLLPGFRFLGNLFWRVISLGLISILAFGPESGTVRRGVLFTLLSMALGGIVLTLGSGGLGALIAAAAAVCLMCGLGFTSGAGQKRYIPIQLIHGGKTVLLTALHDTGNTLRDPVTGERVLVTGPETARLLLGLEREALMDPVGTMVQLGMPGLRLIPYRSVGRGQGMLLGIRVPEMRINGRREQGLVAFAPEGLEGCGEFNALIGGNI